MSFEAQAWAGKVPLKIVSQKAVLNSLANCADQDGFCWPAVQYICGVTALSRRSVQGAIANLEAMGLIVRTGRTRDNGSSQSNHYQLLLAVTAPMVEKEQGGGAAIAHGGAQWLRPPCAAIAPLESSIEQSIKTSTSQNPENADDRKCAEWMFGKIAVIAPKAKPPNWRAWCNDIRLMRERDQHTLHDICALFAWANADSFWSANILSPRTLRDKWTALWLKANSQAKLQGVASPALATDPQRCHCGQAGAVMRNGIGWLCRFHRDELERTGAA